MLVDPALVQRVEGQFARNAADYARALAELDPRWGAVQAERAGGAVVYLGPGMYVNRALGMGVAEAASPADVDFVVDFFAERGFPAEIELCPYADPAISTRAAQRGFTLEWFRNVYVRPIDDDLPAADAPYDFTPVNAANLDRWVGFWERETPGNPAVAPFMRSRWSKPGELDFIVGDEAGQAVAVCSMVVDSGVADLGGMTTAPEHRSRGIQQACLGFRLALAQEHGCDIAVTSATPRGSSARNVERAGFQCIYTSVGLVRRADSPAS
jgi:GNAT superfamily N-acetyltransferase